MSDEPVGAPTILPEVIAIDAWMVELRRHFHAHPELSFQEHKTAARVAAELRGLDGVEDVREGCGRTGVVALIRGGAGPGPCILLRADMDALPLQETGDCPFISQEKGVMHACGHDAHMAALLGAARVLGASRSSFCGVVKLCFQPAEEGFGGARVMISDGILEEGTWGPRVDRVFGAHVWTYAALGTVGAREGPMMAASDKFSIAVRGKGGHGAAPQSTVDAIVVASQLVTALQTVVSRSKDPLDAGVVSCCQINGGSGYNIIADKVDILGTARSFTPATQGIIKDRMSCLCAGIGAAFGAEIEMSYTHGYPPTVNSDVYSLAQLRAAAARVVHPASAVRGDVQTCGAEDFSYFLNARPGCFFFVGAALPGDLRPHHKSVFDLDERCLGITASIFVHLISSLLGRTEPL